MRVLPCPMASPTDAWSGLAGVGNRVRRRLRGEHVIDEWGCDPELVELVDPLLATCCRVDVEGAEQIPPRGPAVLVANRRFGLLEPFVLLRGVRRSTGRKVRFLGIPDVAPVGPVLRRLGGAIRRPDELASLIRAGHLVALPLSPSWRARRSRRRVGTMTPDLLLPALVTEVPVIPVALIGGELSGRWRLLVGEPVDVPEGRGPLAQAELCEMAQDGVQALLDDAFPPRWLLG